MIYIIVIGVLIFYLFIKKPGTKTLTNPFSEGEKRMTIDDKYNSKKVAKEKEINKLLEKINKMGYENLSTKEKNRLTELSKK